MVKDTNLKLSKTNCPTNLLLKLVHRYHPNFSFRYILLVACLCIFLNKTPSMKRKASDIEITTATGGEVEVATVTTTAAISTTFTTSTTLIHYKLVEEEVGKHKRFAAFESNDNDEILKPISIQQWAEKINSSDNNYKNRNDKSYLQEFINLIHQSTSQYDAYFFETKGTSLQNANDKQFEFVLVDSEHLSSISRISGPTPEVFQEHLDCLPSSDTCCAFPNLGNNAILISPKDSHIENRDYSHIGSFMRNASQDEIYQFWRKVVREYLDALQRSPSKSLWLSTSGLGISWLHFRIDNRPKYYTYREFKREK